MKRNGIRPKLCGFGTNLECTQTERNEFGTKVEQIWNEFGTKIGENIRYMQRMNLPCYAAQRQSYRSTEPQSHKATESQSYRATEPQIHRATDIEKQMSATSATTK